MVIAIFKARNASCYLVVQWNFALFLVRHHSSGSHLLGKLFMYCDRYASICRNEISTSLFFGGWQSCTALILSELGFNQSVVNRCPWKFRVDFPNSHFSLRRVG